MNNKKHYVFGPVPSRRLGYSLGVDIIPLKTCNLNCVYCELGRSTQETMTRKEWIPAELVLAEIKQVIQSTSHIDFITFSGSGEPTLNTALGEMIASIKAMTDIPVAVLTNGTLLYMPEVQNHLLDADIVVPSLDAVTPAVFRKIDRPHGHLDICKIVDGIAAFRQRFNNKLLLEILLVKHYNDSPEEIAKLIEACEKIQPDKVQLNTVVRPPAEMNVLPLSRKELIAIQKKFGDIAEVIARFEPSKQHIEQADIEGLIYELILRRPVTAEEISESLGLSEEFVREQAAWLVKIGRIAARPFEGVVYYTAPRKITRNLSGGEVY